jgi:putative phosphoribosyl transferase
VAQVFADRVDAGRQLARRLLDIDTTGLVVLGLPRGGVVVAAEVARALRAPLDILLVQKLGLPICPELALGAVGEGGARALNPDVLTAALIDAQELAAIEATARAWLVRRVPKLRPGVPPLDLTGRRALIVDDGLATGATARAACQMARARGVARVALAVPVAASQALRLLAGVADEVVCLEADDELRSVGSWYQDFTQITDEQALALLRSARGAEGPRHGGTDGLPDPRSPTPGAP